MAGFTTPKPKAKKSASIAACKPKCSTRPRRGWILAHCQERFDEYRNCYNTERPHEALQLRVPA